MNRWVKLAILAVTAVLVTQLIVTRSRPRSAPGEAAPPLVAADLQGRKFDLSDLRGKVVAVNFWATWCGPCREELPELAETWTAHHDRCFELVGVAAESAPEDVAKWAAQVPYPVVLDDRAAAVGAWKVQGYPHTFVVDADGRVRKVFQGGIRRAELEEAIEPLLPDDCRVHESPRPG